MQGNAKAERIKKGRVMLRKSKFKSSKGKTGQRKGRVKVKQGKARLLGKENTRKCECKVGIGMTV